MWTSAQWQESVAHKSSVKTPQALTLVHMHVEMALRGLHLVLLVKVG